MEQELPLTSPPSERNVGNRSPSNNKQHQQPEQQKYKIRRRIRPERNFVHSSNYCQAEAPRLPGRVPSIPQMNSLTEIQAESAAEGPKIVVDDEEVGVLVRDEQMDETTVIAGETTTTTCLPRETPVLLRSSDKPVPKRSKVVDEMAFPARRCSEPPKLPGRIPSKSKAMECYYHGDFRDKFARRFSTAKFKSGSKSKSHQAPKIPRRALSRKKRKSRYPNKETTTTTASAAEDSSEQQELTSHQDGSETKNTNKRIIVEQASSDLALGTTTTTTTGPKKHGTAPAEWEDDASSFHSMTEYSGDEEESQRSLIRQWASMFVGEDGNVTTDFEDDEDDEEEILFELDKFMEENNSINNNASTRTSCSSGFVLYANDDSGSVSDLSMGTSRQSSGSSYQHFFGSHTLHHQQRQQPRRRFMANGSLRGRKKPSLPMRRQSGNHPMDSSIVSETESSTEKGKIGRLKIPLPSIPVRRDSRNLVEIEQEDLVAVGETKQQQQQQELQQQQ